MLPIKGGTFDRTIIEDDINNAEIIIVRDVRFAMRSIVNELFQPDMPRFNPETPLSKLLKHNTDIIRQVSGCVQNIV